MIKPAGTPPLSVLAAGFLWLWLAAAFGTGLTGCSRPSQEAVALEIPRGYTDILEIQIEDRQYRFGPFVGYYFKPETPDDLTRLKFICFNQDRFYTRDLPENARLFEGDAVLTRLARTETPVPNTGRISPVFFPDAPKVWRRSRPSPQEEFRHFHSCYDARGAVLTGFWLRHRALSRFTYDMGGRVGPGSPLYHETTPGPDKKFATIIEFDRGPEAPPNT